jgi:hypothetical protein
MVLKQKNAIGIFPDRQSIESAIALISSTHHTSDNALVWIEIFFS